MTNPKVLVGCPTYDGMEYCLREYLGGVSTLTYPKLDLVVVDNSPTDRYKKKLESLGIKVLKVDWQESPVARVVAARNVLRQYALDHNYDYLLSLEQDVIPPRRAVESLLRHDKPVVAGVYYKPFTLKVKFANGKVAERKDIRPLVYQFIPGQKDKFHFCTKKDVAGDFLMRAAATGLGCMLIHRRVLEMLKFRSDGSLFDDHFFCADLREQDIPLFVDTTVKCKHLLLKKPVQTKKQ
ncbi:MAG: glycosyltransferase family 2 protein [Nanoarchaeota archaeon]|nr:glycosyltransferase family 2 protein [Nanoarchaeota archaeon]